MRGYGAYLQATTFLTPYQQLIGLLDKAIVSVEQAKQGIINKNFEARFNASNHAHQIIFALKSTLDVKKGKDIAQLLYQDYVEIDMLLLEMQTAKNTDLCDITMQKLASIRDTWKELERRV